MDLRVFGSAPETDITAYAPPESTELYGKELSFGFEGGESVTLAFSDGGPLRGVKLKDAVWLITAPDKVYVLDMDAGMITRAVPSKDGGFAISFGSTGGAPSHMLTRDLDGNTMEWTFGNNPESAITERVENGACVITRPNAPDVSTAHYAAVKITDTLYLQAAAVTCGGETVSACLLCDFYSLLCAGAVFCQNGVTIIGGYGRVVPGA